MQIVASHVSAACNVDPTNCPEIPIGTTSHCTELMRAKLLSVKPQEASCHKNRNSGSFLSVNKCFVFF